MAKSRSSGELAFPATSVARAHRPTRIWPAQGRPNWCSIQGETKTFSNSFDAHLVILRLREIQLHADAVGVVEEELRISRARHDALAEFDVARLQALAHRLDIARRKGDVIEPPGVLVLLLGVAHDDPFARLARAHQVHGGLAAGIEPVAGEIER